MKVRMSDDVRAYLRDEAKYLRQRSPAAARALTAAMRKARQNLANFSELGFAKEGLPVPGMRRLIVGNYLLDYEISGDAVLVLAIGMAAKSRRTSPSTTILISNAVIEPLSRQRGRVEGGGRGSAKFRIPVADGLRWP